MCVNYYNNCNHYFIIIELVIMNYSIAYIVNNYLFIIFHSAEFIRIFLSLIMYMFHFFVVNKKILFTR